jgi:hypothetical protein
VILGGEGGHRAGTFSSTTILASSSPTAFVPAPYAKARTDRETGGENNISYRFGVTLGDIAQSLPC